jgi:hypothetical protein
MAKGAEPPAYLFQSKPAQPLTVKLSSAP